MRRCVVRRCGKQRFPDGVAPQLDIVIFAPRAASATESFAIGATRFSMRRQTRSAFGYRGVAGEILERDARCDETRPRDDHLLAFGADEAGASGLGGPHMGTAGGCRSGSARRIDGAAQRVTAELTRYFAVRRGITPSAERFEAAARNSVKLSSGAIPLGEVWVWAP